MTQKSERIVAQAKMTLYLAKPLLIEKAARSLVRPKFHAGGPSFRSNPIWTGNG
jgi:hypothetical protein